jgi:hypothetical protein
MKIIVVNCSVSMSNVCAHKTLSIIPSETLTYLFYVGNKSYVLYTLDKIILQTVKCLQAMANDESISKLVGLFVYHRSRGLHHTCGSPGHNTMSCSHVDPELYCNHVYRTLSQTMEDVYRLQVFISDDNLIGKGITVISIDD